MRADHITEEQIRALTGAISSGAGAAAGEGPGAIGAAEEYRPSVGIVLLNADNEVLVGRRRGVQDSPWQLPQGAIEEGEDPRAAALRELKEETGTDNAVILAESKGWLYYDLPPQIRAGYGPWRGQRQKWFVMRFLGTHSEIDVTGDVEFCDWKWVLPEELPGLAVPFKRSIYASLLGEFGHLTKGG
jgi:putative (di)nucleoside polyphosphate hydrolase